MTIKTKHQSFYEMGADTELRKRYRYAVYEHKVVTAEGLSYSRSFIVLKNRYGVIVHFTSYHKYLCTFEKNICRPMMSDVKAKMHYVCAALNYIIVDNYERFNVNHVFKINKDMLECFFQHYALTKRSNGRCVSSQSVIKCVNTITMFFRKLCTDYCGYMTMEQLETTSNNGVKPTPNFSVRVMPSTPKIFRDMPTSVFEVLLDQAFLHMPEIAFAICAQAFAGLRPGEVCNMRQEKSPLGAGITLTSIDGVLKSAEIDLSAEYMLRSDGVSCGRIKKERIQRVYPAFLQAFAKAYELHKAYLNTIKFEECCPMFVNIKGKAMTSEAYRAKFVGLVNNYLRPTLIKHENPECRIYGQLLLENNLGPHVLRHWFSVQLVLRGEDIAQIQYWRGDGDPESALSYLQNKSDLIREYADVNEVFAKMLLLQGGE